MDWLDTQTELEKPLLEVTGEVVKELVDDLLPQIRLAGIENGGKAAVNVEITFEFINDGAEINATGSTVFPAKKAHTKAVL